jgi:putative membrane fusion protein
VTGMRKRRQKTSYLKVIEGQGKASPMKTGGGGKPKWVYYLLILLASFLIAQILIGWVWRTASQGFISTILAGESKVDVSFSIPGTITFEEKLILAPCSGFVYYKIAEGQRVPVDKELAEITTFPLEKGDNIVEEVETSQSLQRIKNWFLGEKKEEHTSSSPGQEKSRVIAPQPGLISFRLDGLEEFGPQSKFPYFSKDELQNEICPGERLSPGEKVHRFMPLLKIVNNYYWYFSVVLPPDLGKLVAEKPKVKLYFSFAPEVPVWGEKVELRERGEDGSLEVTWCIGRELPGLYNQRRCEAKVVYKDLQGVLVPKSVLWEMEGRQGVYILEKGLIRFRDVDILMEREDDVLIENLEDRQRVVAQPASVKEGQRYNW